MNMLSRPRVPSLFLLVTSVTAGWNEMARTPPLVSNLIKILLNECRLRYNGVRVYCVGQFKVALREEREDYMARRLQQLKSD